MAASSKCGENTSTRSKVSGGSTPQVSPWSGIGARLLSRPGSACSTRMNTPSARAVTTPPALIVPTVKTLRPSVRSTHASKVSSCADRRRTFVADGERAGVRAEAEARVHRAEQLVEHHRHDAAVHGAGRAGVGRRERAVPAHALAVEGEHDRRRDRVERADHRAVREEARRVAGGELLAVGVRGAQRVLARDAVDLVRREERGRLPHQRGRLLEHVDRRVGHALGREQLAGGVDQVRGRRRMCHLGRSVRRGSHRRRRLRPHHTTTSGLTSGHGRERGADVGRQVLRRATGGDRRHEIVVAELDVRGLHCDRGTPQATITSPARV